MPTDQVTLQETLDAFYDAYNAHDPARVEPLYAADGVHEEIAQGNRTEGAAAVRDGFAGFLGAFPDAHWEPELMIVQGSAAAVPYRLTGTLQGQLGPFAPAGQPLDLRGVHVFEVDDAGAIARSADYWDGGTFGRQMKAG